jgi:hypothetical protein
MTRAAIAALLSAALLSAVLAAPALAQKTKRTEDVCFKLNYEQRESMAARGDPDATYCSAVWSAAAYVDETKKEAERNALRAKALAMRARAERLGYRFDGIVMFGMTFDELIADGDELTANGGERPRAGDAFGDYLGCSAQIGAACMAQCGGQASCQAACQGQNAWRCNRP